MADFQPVKSRRGNQPTQTIKYADQHQKLLEMGFNTADITKALESSQGNLEAATLILLDLDDARVSGNDNNNNDGYVEKVETTKASNKTSAKSESNRNNGNGKAANKTESVKELHQRMMATYKVTKCREGANHDKRMCMFWHSLSDRRRNPFEYTYSCFDCPAMTSTGECKDGDNCQHAHTMLEKMFHPELYKISMCQRTQRGESCDRGILCAFAHNETDLRIISPSAIPKVPPPSEWKPAKPIPNSNRLNTLVERIALLLKEAGPEGAGGTEIARKYSERYHESMELEDEQKEKYKFRDLVTIHPNITIMTNRSGPLRYLYDESRSNASPVAVVSTENNGNNSKAEESNAVKADSQLLATIRDRLVQIIRSAGSDGILGSDLPKRYQELFHEKLPEITDESGMKIKLKDILASQTGVSVQMLKLQPKYVYDGPVDTNNTPAAPVPAPVPAAPVAKSAAAVVASSTATTQQTTTVSVAPVSQNPPPVVQQDRNPANTAASVVVSGKSYSSVAATIRAAAAAAENKQQQQQPATVHSRSNSVSHHEETNTVVDDSAPSAEDPIFTNQLSDLNNRTVENTTATSFNSENITFQSAFGYGVNQSDNGLIGGSHDDLMRKNPEPLMAAPGLTKLTGSSTLDNSSISSLLGNANTAAAPTSLADFHERLNHAQAQIVTLQQTINKLQGDLHSRNQEFDGQTMQLRNVMQRLAEAESKTGPSDEQVKQQLKTKTDELAQKTRDVSKIEEEVRKLREERKGDLNQFFINLSQIEDAISAMKCKEENYSDKVRSDDVQELLQFRKALRTFLTTLKGQLKVKFDQLTTQTALSETTNLAVTSPLSAALPQAPRYVPPVTSGYDAGYYAPLNSRTDAFGSAYVGYSAPVDSGLCALPGCRNQGHYTCAGCQKVSYCGADHQRLHWVQHSLNCHHP